MDRGFALTDCTINVLKALSKPLYQIKKKSRKTVNHFQKDILLLFYHYLIEAGAEEKIETFARESPGETLDSVSLFDGPNKSPR
jgi:hypothetical protein